MERKSLNLKDSIPSFAGFYRVTERAREKRFSKKNANKGQPDSYAAAVHPSSNRLFPADFKKKTKVKEPHEW